MIKSHIIKLVCRLVLVFAALNSLSCASDGISAITPKRLKTGDNIDFTQTADKAIEAGIKRNESGLYLTNEDKRYLLKAARTVLKNNFSDNPKQVTKNDFDNISPNLLYQSAKLFVTLLVNGKVRGCRSAEKGDLLENTINATRRAIDDERFGGTLRSEELPNTRVDFTFLLRPARIREHTLKKIKKQIEIGMHAISLRNGNKRAFFKNSVPVSHGYSLKTTLQRLGKKAKIGSDAYKSPNTNIYKYNTIQFCEGLIDSSLVNLYRSNLPIYQSDVYQQAHLSGLRLCGDYMKNHINGDGLMTYEYDAYRDRKNNPTTSTSAIRRLASTWALASIGKYFNDARYIRAAKRSIDYFFDRHYIYDARQNFGYIQIGKDANLALASFMLCCLLEVDDRQYHAEEKQHLINFILAMEDRDKGFFYPVYLPDKETNFERKEIYYPGEALTAIMLLYKATHNPEYLAAAERVFDYYRKLFARASRRASMAPWMSKAYTEVFLATGKRKYAEFVLQMNDYVLKAQKGIDEEYVDKIGSFYSSGSSSGTGVFVEGIAEAYRVAKVLNDAERIEAYRKSVLMGNRFILQCQYTDQNMFTAKDQRLTLGGIRTTIYGNTIRIDSNQHGGLALLKALEYIYNNNL